MTITQLRYIVALANHRHFKRAADECFVTQPTLSMQIQRLEEDLDILLFDRSKKPVTITPAGNKIIDQARKTLSELDRLPELADEAKGELGGTFRLGAIPTVAPYLLPIFVQRFTKKYPKVKLVIEELETEQVINKMKVDQLDAGIVAVPLNESGINEQHLYYEPFLAFVPKHHRLENEEFILQSELDINDILLLDEGHCFRNNVVNLCKKQPDSDDKQLTLNSGNFQTLLKFSKQGYGMTLLPYLTALELGARDKKYVKPFEAPKPTREIGLIYSRTQAKIRILDALRESILDLIPKALRTHEAGKRTNPTA